ncbi:hypothetical protein [Tunturiibacter lichenicola]|jgi:hypothetical protein|uniref:hypothetical protein n=1 Tax=Tunturiibacter lichenicola TaxID=2051959 RepID=UPI003D9BA13E
MPELAHFIEELSRLAGTFDIAVNDSNCRSLPGVGESTFATDAGHPSHQENHLIT